jgi:hypothetical protein
MPIAEKRDGDGDGKFFMFRVFLIYINSLRVAEFRHSFFSVSRKGAPGRLATGEAPVWLDAYFPTKAPPAASAPVHRAMSPPPVLSHRGSAFAIRQPGVALRKRHDRSFTRMQNFQTVVKKTAILKLSSKVQKPSFRRKPESISD